MTLLEITLWSFVAAVAIGAMIAHWKWSNLKDAFSALADTRDGYKHRWKNAADGWREAERDAAAANAINRSAIKIIARMSADLIAADRRAGLHCRMMEAQRSRGDAIWRRLLRIGRQMVRAEAALADALDHRVTWSTCPVCGRLVACTGWPWSVGTCRHCNYIVAKPEVWPADPIKVEADHLAAAARLYQAGKQLHDVITNRPRVCIEQTQGEARLGRALDAAIKHWPDIVNPPAFRPENKTVANFSPRAPRMAGHTIAAAEITWSKCPRCDGVVPCHGRPLLGQCHRCGYKIWPSEINEVPEPAQPAAVDVQAKVDAAQYAATIKGELPCPPPGPRHHRSERPPMGRGQVTWPE